MKKIKNIEIENIYGEKYPFALSVFGEIKGILENCEIKSYSSLLEIYRHIEEVLKAPNHNHYDKLIFEILDSEDNDIEVIKINLK